MRYGFTTGSCAAAAAKAATYMLLSGIRKENIEIETPSGKMFDATIVDIQREEARVSCSVIKDGGDDPDVTTGAHVCAVAELGNPDIDDIELDGGVGVGRVTRPGLNQPVGNAAINSVPRQMITKEVREVKELLDFHGTIKITISVPEGIELASKTFNPRLGIENGISILGTTGIVEPMSNQALIDTIRVELNQKKAMGHKCICISPGNYGLDFMKATFDYNLDLAVKCSNFIGVTLDIAKEIGFEKILMVGHLGKLVKVAGGIMNTHSKEADCRMEIMASTMVKAANAVGFVLDNTDILKVLDCVNTEEAFSLVKGKDQIVEAFSSILISKIQENMQRRAGESVRIECMVYTNEHGLIGASKDAYIFMEEIKGIDLV